MNKRVKTVAVAVLLLGMASLMGGCRKGIVENVSPETKVIAVGDTAIISCMFNKGREVDWSKSNDNVSFLQSRSSKEDEIDIIGLKEGDCQVIADGRKNTQDICNVKVKTKILPEEPIVFHKGDVESIKVQSGYSLNYEIKNSNIVSLTLNQDINGDITDFYSYLYTIKSKNIGETWIRFYNEVSDGQVVDTGILVKVLLKEGYFEPVDFDDTQDSVSIKVGRDYDDIKFNDDGSMEWNYYNYYDSDLLMIKFDKDNIDLVNAFGVSFSNEDAKTRIIDGIKANYIYNSLYSALLGYDVYVNVDATKLVALDNGVYLSVVYIPFNKSVKVQDLLGQRLNKIFDVVKNN
jgi:hypothetical protein